MKTNLLKSSLSWHENGSGEKWRKELSRGMVWLGLLWGNVVRIATAIPTRQIIMIFWEDREPDGKPDLICQEIESTTEKANQENSAIAIGVPRNGTPAFQVNMNPDGVPVGPLLEEVVVVGAGEVKEWQRKMRNDYLKFGGL